MADHSNKITYESLWKAIIRPPRDYYRLEELGPTSFKFYGRMYTRKDFEIVDFQGKLLKVSFIEPDIKDRPNDIMPCVIYMHGNSSSRVEGIRMRRYLLRYNINICCFDFEGSGYSEGEYISLGYHEKHQVKNVVDFVEKYPGVGEIGLWGRSMGAATTLIYASMDERIKAIVADSPFTDFRRVAKETCLSQVSVPGFLVEGAISIIGKSVFKKNKMKINEIKPIEAVKNCKIPVIFIHAKDDEIIKFQHTLDLYNSYAGSNKKLKDVNGGHNGNRGTFLMESVGQFFYKYLNGEGVDINFNEDDINGDNKLNLCKTEKCVIPFGLLSDDEDIPMEKMNFNLNNRTKKTIYEEWGIGANTFTNKDVKKIIGHDNKRNNTIKENENEEDTKDQEKNEEKNKKNSNSNQNDKNQVNLENNNKKDLNKDENKNNNDNNNNGNAINNKNHINENEKKDKEVTDLNDIDEDQHITPPPRIKRKTIYDDLHLRPAKNKKNK